MLFRSEGLQRVSNKKKIRLQRNYKGCQTKKKRLQTVAGVVRVSHAIAVVAQQWPVRNDGDRRGTERAGRCGTMHRKRARRGTRPGPMRAMCRGRRWTGQGLAEACRSECNGGGGGDGGGLPGRRGRARRRRGRRGHGRRGRPRGVDVGATGRRRRRAGNPWRGGRHARQRGRREPAAPGRRRLRAGASWQGGLRRR